MSAAEIARKLIEEDDLLNMHNLGFSSSEEEKEVLLSDDTSEDDDLLVSDGEDEGEDLIELYHDLEIIDDTSQSQFDQKLSKEKQEIRNRLPRYSVELIRAPSDDKTEKKTRLNSDGLEFLLLFFLWVVFIGLLFYFTSMSHQVRIIVAFTIGMISIPGTIYLSLHLYEVYFLQAKSAQPKVIIK